MYPCRCGAVPHSIVADIPMVSVDLTVRDFPTALKWLRICGVLSYRWVDTSDPPSDVETKVLKEDSIFDFKDTFPRLLHYTLAS